MDRLLFDFKYFEEWFRSKLIEEKNIRLKYIESTWDNLSQENRENLITFLDNKIVTKYKFIYIDKKFNEIYLVLKEQFELCYEFFKAWSNFKK